MDPRVQDKALLRAQRDHVVEQIGSGGYRFASLEELDAVIRRWQSELQGLEEDGRGIQQAIRCVTPPAADYLSVGQANATIESLNLLVAENRSAQRYALGYLTKLKAVRRQYADSEQHADTVMKNVGKEM